MPTSVVGSIIELLKKQIVEAVIKAVKAKIPLFAGWFMSGVLSWIVPYIIDVLYDKGALAVNWVWIIVDNHLELKAALKTKEKLGAILAAGGDYTQAEKEFNDATDDLIERDMDRLPR